jgi:beta-phosphoglucomutase
MHRRAVIFDMDGVLVDSYHAHLKAWQRLGEELGRPVTEEAFIPTFGRRNPEIFTHLWGEDFSADQVGRWGDWKEVAYRRIITERFPAMDGAAELIDALAAAGLALAIGSSGPLENVEAALAGLGRAEAFQAVVSRDDVTRGKPDPEVFLKTAEKLRIEPRRCAVVEDALVGLEAARQAGMAPIALVGTFRREQLAPHADWVVDSLRDLAPEDVVRLIDRGA